MSCSRWFLQMFSKMSAICLTSFRQKVQKMITIFGSHVKFPKRPEMTPIRWHPSVSTFVLGEGVCVGHLCLFSCSECHEVNHGQIFPDLVRFCGNGSQNTFPIFPRSPSTPIQWMHQPPPLLLEKGGCVSSPCFFPVVNASKLILAKYFQICTSFGGLPA